MKLFMQEDFENEIVGLAMPHIKKLCYGKWFNLELEDRIIEAAYFFICALRNLPIDSGHFMSDYEDALVPYMNEQNRKEPSRYHRCDRSLDDPGNTNNTDKKWTLYDILSGPDIDQTAVDVDSFLNSLPIWQKNILQDRMIYGYTETQVAHKYGFPNNKLKKVLLKIGDIYQQGQWSKKQT